MKKLALIFAIGVSTVLYSTGLFVPETQGVENTFAGLMVLSDAEMAYQVGGPIDQPRRPSYPEIESFPSGEKAVCAGASGNCGARPDCDTSMKLYHDWKHKCTPCDVYTWFYVRRQYMYKPSPIKTFCINRSDGCFYRWMPGGKIRTCEEKVSNTCRPDLDPDKE